MKCQKILQLEKLEIGTGFDPINVDAQRLPGPNYRKRPLPRAPLGTCSSTCISPGTGRQRDNIIKQTAPFLLRTLCIFQLLNYETTADFCCNTRMIRPPCQLLEALQSFPPATLSGRSSNIVWGLAYQTRLLRLRAFKRVHELIVEARSFGNESKFF